MVTGETHILHQIVNANYHTYSRTTGRDDDAVFLCATQPFIIALLVRAVRAVFMGTATHILQQNIEADAQRETERITFNLSHHYSCRLCGLEII